MAKDAKSPASTGVHKVEHHKTRNGTTSLTNTLLGVLSTVCTFMFALVAVHTMNTAIHDDENEKTNLIDNRIHLYVRQLELDIQEIKTILRNGSKR